MRLPITVARGHPGLNVELLDLSLAQIAGGFDSMQRWVFRPEYDATVRAVVGDIEGRNLISQAISNIALEGIMTPETAADWLQEQVETLLADRSE